MKAIPYSLEIKTQHRLTRSNFLFCIYRYFGNNLFPSSVAGAYREHHIPFYQILFQKCSPPLLSQIVKCQNVQSCRVKVPLQIRGRKLVSSAYKKLAKLHQQKVIAPIIPLLYIQTFREVCLKPSFFYFLHFIVKQQFGHD